MTGELLRCEGLVTGFGANQVLHGVDLSVGEGEVVGIFGLNGAGKSVAMKTISGLQPLWQGSVTFEGRRIDHLTPEARVEAGIGNVPQGRQVFPELTIEENLRLGAYTSRKRDRSSWPARRDAVYDQFPVLGEKRDVLAGTLSGGQRASLAVGRALVNEPKLLLIDEPSAGLAPSIVGDLLRILRQVADTGMTMLLIEQNIRFGLQMAEHAVILQTGRVVHEGRTDEMDHGRLSELLGIGRMLSSSTAAAVTTPAAATAEPAPAAGVAPGRSSAGQRRRTRRRRPLVAPTLEELAATRAPTNGQEE